MVRSWSKIKKWLNVGCAGCGRCCTETIVPITDADVRRLMQQTGKAASQIVRFFSSRDIQRDADDAGWIRLSYGWRFLGLKKRFERCQFLDDFNRCTVYSARPLTCQTFPLQIYLDDTKSEIEDISLNRGVKKQYPMADQPLQSRDEVLRKAQTEDREDEAYGRKVQQWNASGQLAGKTEFLQFLGLE